MIQGILEQNGVFDVNTDRSETAAGRKISLMGKLFGCWHKRLTRPMTSRHESYRACIECGARKNFNTESFKSSGPFYYPPSVRPDSNRSVT